MTGSQNQRRKSGRHPEKALTAAQVRAAVEPGKYRDGNGLFLRVEPSGSKRWVQRITIRGKITELGLGSASLVSLAEAREQAFENRKLARSGSDPMRARREASAIMSFEEAARHVHDVHTPSWRNAKHAAQFISTLETYAFPRLGRLRVSEITTADVLAVLQPIWLEKAETARRVRQRIGMVMKWAIAQGWRQDNPVLSISEALPKQDRTQAHRKALHYNALPEFVEKLQASGANLSTRLALELLILTASRSGEVRLAQWSEFDLEAALWIRPASRMKANKEHRVPLSGRALEVLTEAQALKGEDDLVFPGTKYGKPLSDMTLLKLAKSIVPDIHVHGFRTSFKTWAQERTNFAREVSEAALAHTIRDKAEAAYARSDLFEKRRKIMEGWADFLVAPSVNIVQLPGGARG